MHCSAKSRCSTAKKEKREKCFLFNQTIWIFSEVYWARSNFSSITWKLGSWLVKCFASLCTCLILEKSFKSSIQLIFYWLRIIILMYNDIILQFSFQSSFTYFTYVPDVTWMWILTICLVTVESNQS